MLWPKIALLLAVCCGIEASKVVEMGTPFGRVVGNTLQYDNGLVIDEFLRIPFAVPPLGELRFRPSSHWKQPYAEEPHNATYYSPACVQPLLKSEVHISEDCLYLNIWRPHRTQSHNAESGLLPVAVYIHGGSFIVGSGTIAMFNGSDFVALGGAQHIYVSINYRLGPLGFINLREIYEEDTEKFPSFGGQNGLFDQIVALKWVQQNIEYYGGDATAVTIFGESAGGLSVCGHLLSPLSAALFNRAIVQSGVCNGPWQSHSLPNGLQYARNRLLTAGFPTDLTALRQMDAFEFVWNLTGKHSETGWIGHSVDGYVLPRQEFELMTEIGNGKAKLNVDSLMIGVTSQDGLSGWPYFLGTQPTTEEQFSKAVLEYSKWQPSVFTAIVDDFYKVDQFLNASVAWYALGGDTCVVCPTLDFVNGRYLNASKLGVRQFAYMFEGTAIRRPLF